MFSQALKLTPRNPELLNQQGLAYAGEKKYEEAVICYRQAYLINPAFPRARLNEAQAYLDAQRFKKAEQCCRQALKAAPQDAETYNLLGGGKFFSF